LRPELQPFTRDPAHAAILLDFDGTLADIVARPELAEPAEGARDAVGELVARYGLVAVVSGRPTDDVRALLGVDGVTYAGHYGAGSAGDDLSAGVASDAHAASGFVPGAWVEDKGSSVAVHYRQAAEPKWARDTLLASLRGVADERGLELIEGKMVLELVPRDRPRKGSAVQRLVRDAGARAALFAGDDLADVEAFEALDRLARDGVAAVKVAVRGAEEWPDLLRAADIVVEGPRGLIALLRELAG
jgi:trehalose 6-phosphate phosphatase